MPINNNDRKKLRKLGHHLKPVIIIAQKGLTGNIKEEIDRALNDHELIKLKLLASTKVDKKELTNEICSVFNAECIQSIGHVILIYRAAKNQNPKLSNLIRALVQT